MIMKFLKEKKIIEKITGLKPLQWVIIYAALFVIGALYVFLRFAPVTEAYIFRGNKKEAIQVPYFDTTNIETHARYEAVIHSKLPQKVKMTIVVPDIMTQLTLNGKEIDLNFEKKKYKQRQLDHNLTGYPFHLKLKAGNNVLTAAATFTHEGNGLKIHQMFMVHDYIIFFFCLVLWIFHLGAVLFFMLMHKLFNLKPVKSKINWAYIIILLGIMIRILYVFSYGDGSYNHDHMLHIDYIKYVANHFQVPPPDKGTEFPQQPIYYFLTGSVYAICQAIGFHEKIILVILAWVSCIMNVGFLLIAYQFVRLIFDKELPRIWFTAFMALTPTFVYTAGRINNDVLIMLFGIAALYYFAKYIKQNKDSHLLAAIVYTVLGFFTKVSFAMWMIIIMIVLLKDYFILLKENLPEKADMRKIMQRRVFLFGVLCVFLFGLTLQRVHLPGKEQFRFVNSGKFPGQAIHRLGTDYLLSFKFFDLLIEGQSYSYEKTDVIKQSFFTYQYGTFMFGEYDYKKITGAIPAFGSLMRLIYFFGIIYIIGLLAYIFFIRHHDLFYKLMGITALINLILIFQLAFNFPSACNTDFRYFSPAFAAFGVMIAVGLQCLIDRFKNLKIPVVIFSVILYTLQISWLVWLIFLGIPNSVS